MVAAGDPREVATELEAWGRERSWAGSDPYDALNATRLTGPLRRSTLGRRILTQLVKRSPLDLRPALGIADARSSAAIAHVAASYARNGFLPPEKARSRLLETLQVLEALRCAQFDEPCWGYHFDVQTRVFFYPRGAPNTIATAFAGLALLDAYEYGNREDALKSALRVGDFFLRNVPQTQSPPGAYFGYLVGDRTPIHNANMLVCGLLARLSRYSDRRDLLGVARAGVRYTVARQRPDGSWPYGEERHLAWVDGFHSGYVLDSLMTCVEAGIDDGAPEALRRGLRFFAQALFLPDGTPKYTPTSIYPIDVQCAAQGIQTLARASLDDPSYAAPAWSAYGYAISKLRRADGAFIFQRRRFWRNRAAHVRWGEAPMLLALTHLLRLPSRAA